MLSCKSNIKRDENNDRPNGNNAIHADIVYVGDRSGSMEIMGDAPKNGLKEFIAEQQSTIKKEGISCSFTICTFDIEPEEINFNDINDVKMTEEMYDNMLTPRGCTRLIDTALEQLEKQNKRVNEYVNNLSNEVKKLNPKITKIFAVMTDGIDNFSEHCASDLNEKILDAKNKGTVCLFLGANQDAIHSGEVFGFSRSNCLTFGSTPQHMAAAMRSVSSATNRIISGQGEGFTPLERSVSQPLPNHNHNHNLNMMSSPPSLPKRDVSSLLNVNYII